MALAILKSFYEKGTFHGGDVLEKFLDWLNTRPKDVGYTTRSSLELNKETYKSNPQSEGSWHQGSYQLYLENPQNSANGALMRNGVIPLLTSDISKAIDWSIQHSIITHYSIPAVLPCIVQTVLIHRALNGDKSIPTTETIREILLGSSGEWYDYKQELYAKKSDGFVSKDVIQWLERVGGKVALHMEEKKVFKELSSFETFDPYHFYYKGVSGWSVLSLKIALWSLFHSKPGEALVAPNHLPSWTFEEQPKGFETITFVVMIGADADTYGAIAGPMLAAHHPIIPKALVDDLIELPSADLYTTHL